MGNNERSFYPKKYGYDIFLGGTTNNSNWRDTFIKTINKKCPNIRCFNPVVDNWTPQCIELENFIKQESKYHLYVITPKMIGVYSIAEAVESVMNPDKKTYFTILTSDHTNIQFDNKIFYSLTATAELIKNHGGIVNIGNNLDSTIDDIIKDFNAQPTIRSNRII